MIRWFYKITGCVVVGLLGMSAISYMQKRYDDLDVRKAVSAIYAKYPEWESSHDCFGEVTSRTYGVVAVHCRGEGHPEQVFHVDVTRGLIDTPSP